MKKLLIELRKHVPTHIGIPTKPKENWGLCSLVISLKNEGIFTTEEYEQLLNYIEDHRPKRGKHFMESRKDSSYYWTPSDIKPRIAWLNYRIKKERY